MGAPAAAKGSQVVGVDIHIVMVPSPGGPIPTPLPHPFSGQLDGNLVDSVKIGGQPAATVGSTVTNSPGHIATPPGTSFQSPPADKGTVDQGSSTVKIGGQAAARAGDPVKTCNDPSDQTTGAIIATGTVLIG